MKLRFIPLPRGWKARVKEALLHAVGLERLAIAEVRAGFDKSSDPRARLTSEVDRLRELVELQAEELRILRARLDGVPPLKRPHYPPAERLAILMLRAKSGWNASETARHFGLTAATVASWMRRLAEQGTDALVATPSPVNRFDDGVTLLAQRLHQAAPNLGRRKLADVLARAGLHLAASTVRRMLKKRPGHAPAPPSPSPSPPCPRDQTSEDTEPKAKPEQVVTAREPHHVWHVDLTSHPMGPPGSGFWVPWWPFALVLRWVLSFHVGMVVDHFSRVLVAFAVFEKEPTAGEVCALLDRAVEKAGRAPRYIVSDQGAQFQSEYRAWCKERGIRPRFGAIGQHGSIAVIERFILSFKNEFLRKLFLPYSPSKIEAMIAAYAVWYNEHRPHSSLGGRTPAEVLDGRPSPRDGTRYEPRSRFPLARGSPNVKRVGKLELVVSHVHDHALLPVVVLREAP